jgi:hypothetical protein
MVVGAKLPQEQAPPEKTPSPKPQTTRAKKKTGDSTWGPTKPRRAPAARSAPQVEKRKLRSQGEPNQVTLLESKIARSKSKSSPSREGARVATAQVGASEEHSIRDPPRGRDQVSTMIVFGRLFEAFHYLDSIKRTREVCLQEKAATPTTSNPTTRRAPKLKCFIPFKP